MNRLTLPPCARVVAAVFVVVALATVQVAWVDSAESGTTVLKVVPDLETQVNGHQRPVAPTTDERHRDVSSSGEAVDLPEVEVKTTGGGCCPTYDRDYDCWSDGHWHRNHCKEATGCGAF